MNNKRLLLMGLFIILGQVNSMLGLKGSFEKSGTPLKPRLEGIETFKHHGYSSLVACNCEKNYTPECVFLDGILMRVNKHSEVLSKIKTCEKALEKAENSSAKIVLERLIKELKEGYPDHEKEDFELTLSSEEKKKLDEVKYALLKDLRADNIDSEAKMMDDVLTSKVCILDYYL